MVDKVHFLYSYCVLTEAVMPYVLPPWIMFRMESSSVFVANSMVVIRGVLKLLDTAAT
jgi:hypothetical protein